MSGAGRNAAVMAAALDDREVAFVGKLVSMTRSEAAERVEAAGGRVARETSATTSYVVVGHAGWPLRADGHPTRALVRAREVKERSKDLSIVSETTFLQLLGLQDKVEDLERLFTTAQLSRILNVPAAQIRAWRRRDLIRPAKVARRLAWFDFGEVVMARALHSLTKAGVSTARIGRSIRDLSSWLPDAQRMLTQIETYEQGKVLQIRLQDGRLADTAGQLLFDFHGQRGAEPDIRLFEPPAGEHADNIRPFADTVGGAYTGAGVDGASGGPAGGPLADEPFPPGPFADGPLAGLVSDDALDLASAGTDDLFEQGVLAEDAGEWELAVRLYERALEIGAEEPEIYFNLGNALYELDRKKEAARRYLQAVEQEGDYVESLNNLGNALAETGWLTEAVQAYRRALRLEPAYADAHSNLGETLVYLGRYDEARFHWNAYLELDPSSSWAAAIRELLRNLPTDRN